MENKILASFGIGMVSGLIAGGAIALIFAPKSGKETRKLIINAAGEVVDAVEEETHEVLDSVKNVASEANRRGHAVVDAITGKK